MKSFSPAVDSMRRIASLSLLSFFMPKPPPKRYSDLNFDLMWHALQNVFKVSTSVICIQPQRMIALANGGNHIIPIPKFQATHMHKFVIHRFLSRLCYICRYCSVALYSPVSAWEFKNRSQIPSISHRVGPLLVSLCRFIFASSNLCMKQH